MTDIGDVKTRVRAIQNASANSKEIHDVLIWLKRNVNATESLLRETKVGLAVGKLRSNEAKEVADLAKELVKKWKSEIERTKSKSTTPTAPLPVKPTVQVDTKVAAARGLSTVSPATPATPVGDSARSADTDKIPKRITDDDVRDKCIVMLYNALCFDSDAPTNRILPRAREIEEAVLKFNRGKTESAYRTKIRSLYLNLKDKANPGLRETVISGELPASKLPTMTPQELASEERQQAYKKISDANFFASLGSEEMGAETDAFQCGRCKQRKTRYRQQQTRSADEPMTTFVTCVNCGNRWKFS